MCPAAVVAVHTAQYPLHDTDTGPAQPQACLIGRPHLLVLLLAVCTAPAAGLHTAPAVAAGSTAVAAADGVATAAGMLLQQDSLAGLLGMHAAAVAGDTAAQQLVHAAPPSGAAVTADTHALADRPHAAAAAAAVAAAAQ